MKQGSLESTGLITSVSFSQQVFFFSTSVSFFPIQKYIKPLFSDESYLELYRRQKKHLNTQQLAAFRLLFAWRDKTARQEDESTG